MGKWTDRVDKYIINPLGRADDAFYNFTRPPEFDEQGKEVGVYEPLFPDLVDFAYDVFSGFCGITSNLTLAFAEYVDSKIER